MKTWRKFILLGLVTLVLATGLAWVFRQTFGMLLLQQIAQRNVSRNAMLELPDGLHLALCGTGSPFPDPSRAGPCSAIIAEDRLGGEDGMPLTL